MTSQSGESQVCPVLYGLNMSSVSGYGQYARNLVEGFSRLGTPFRLVDLRGRSGPPGIGFREPVQTDIVVGERARIPRAFENLWRFGLHGWSLPTASLGNIHHAMNQVIVPKIRRTPLVVTFHDLAPLRPPEKSSNIWRRLLYSTALSVIRKHRLPTMCPSNFVKKQLLEEGIPEGLVTVVNYGISVHRKPHTALQTLRRNLPRTKLLLSVGGEQLRKRIDLQLKTIKLLPEWTLLRAAPGPPSPKSQRLIRDLRVASRVVYLNLPTLGSHDVVCSLYQIATCLLHTATYGGFEIPPVEAATLGLPVVCPALEPMTELLRGVEFVRDFEDPAALAEGVLRAETVDPYEAQHHVAKFTIERMARETFLCYKTALGHA